MPIFPLGRPQRDPKLCAPPWADRKETQSYPQRDGCQPPGVPKGSPKIVLTIVKGWGGYLKAGSGYLKVWGECLKVWEGYVKVWRGVGISRYGVGISRGGLGISRDGVGIYNRAQINFQPSASKAQLKSHPQCGGTTFVCGDYFHTIDHQYN